jgi:hypothetical protein
LLSSNFIKMRLKEAIINIHVGLIATSFLILYVIQATKAYWIDELYWLLSGFFITLSVSALTTLLLEHSLARRTFQSPEYHSARLEHFVNMEDEGFEYYAGKFEIFDEEILSKLPNVVTRWFSYVVISGRRFHETHLDVLKQLLKKKDVEINAFVPDTESQIGEILANKRGVAPAELGKRIQGGLTLITDHHDPSKGATLQIWKYREIPTYTAYKIDDMIYLGVYRYQGHETRMEFYGYRASNGTGRVYAEDMEDLRRKSVLIYPKT